MSEGIVRTIGVSFNAVEATKHEREVLELALKQTAAKDGLILRTPGEGGEIDYALLDPRASLGPGLVGEPEGGITRVICAANTDGIDWFRTGVLIGEHAARVLGGTPSSDSAAPSHLLPQGGEGGAECDPLDPSLFVVSVADLEDPRQWHDLREAVLLECVRAFAPHEATAYPMKTEVEKRFAFSLVGKINDLADGIVDEFVRRRVAELRAFEAKQTKAGE